MRVVGDKMYQIDRIYETIELGMQGDHLINDLVFDVSPWMNVYPNGTFFITYTYPKSTAVYTLHKNTYTLVNKVLTIPITRALTFYDGNGTLSFRLVDTNGDEKFSAVEGTRVQKSHYQGNHPTPDPIQDWITQSGLQIGAMERATEESVAATEEALVVIDAAQLATENATEAANRFSQIELVVNTNNKTLELWGLIDAPIEIEMNGNNLEVYQV